MRTMPISQINSVLGNKRVSLKKTIKNTSQYIMPYYNSIKIGSSALIISALPLLCGDDEDNYGYGDSEYEKRQKRDRENSEYERNRRYYGYDTPGLGSGSREVDW